MADAAGFREALEEPIVKVSYDRGNLVAVEILDASQRVTDARRVDFQRTENLEGSTGSLSRGAHCGSPRSLSLPPERLRIVRPLPDPCARLGAGETAPTPRG